MNKLKVLLVYVISLNCLNLSASRPWERDQNPTEPYKFGSNGS